MTQPRQTSQTASDLYELQSQLYRATRSRSSAFDNLSSWLIDLRNLRATWSRVRRLSTTQTPTQSNPEPILQQTSTRSALTRLAEQLRTIIERYDSRESNLQQTSTRSALTRLAEQLRTGQYRPTPPRWIALPKPDKPGKSRRIGILCFHDRVVHTALAQILQPIVDHRFLDTSFGFRPGQSVATARHAATSRVTVQSGESPRYSYALSLDITDCFDTIDHQHLLEQLSRHVDDRIVNELLYSILISGGTRTGWLRPRNHGVVQGSALSPLLCNIALHSLDEAFANFASQHHHSIACLRYADDILLLGRDRRALDRALNITRRILRAQHQSIRVGQPKYVLRDGIEWLGIHLQPRPHPGTGRIPFGAVIPDH